MVRISATCQRASAIASATSVACNQGHGSGELQQMVQFGLNMTALPGLFSKVV